MRSPLSKCAVVGCVFLCATVTSVQAQRSWTGATYLDNEGHLFLHEGGSGPATWRWPKNGISHSGFVSVPTIESASALLVKPNVFLVSGNGWLLEVEFDLSGSVPVATTTQINVPGMDLLKLSFSDAGGLLFAVDGVSKSMVAAPYVVGSGVVGTWQVVVTSAQCAALDTPEILELRDHSPAVGVNIGAVEPFIGVHYLIAQDAAGWTVTNLSDGSVPVVLPDAWLVDDYPSLSSDTANYELWVGGGSGLFFIEDEIGNVVHVGTHGGSPSGETFNIPVAAFTWVFGNPCG